MEPTVAMLVLLLALAALLHPPYWRTPDLVSDCPLPENGWLQQTKPVEQPAASAHKVRPSLQSLLPWAVAAIALLRASLFVALGA